MPSNYQQQPPGAKAFFWINVIVTALLVVFYIFYFFISLITYHQAKYYNEGLSLFVIGVSVVFFAALYKSDASEPFRKFLIYNFFWACILLLLFFLNIMLLFSDIPGYLRHMKTKTVVVEPEISKEKDLVQIAKDTYHQWLRQQEYTWENEKIQSMIEKFYDENAQTRIKVIGRVNVDMVEFKRNELKLNALTYYYSSIPGIKTYIPAPGEELDGYSPKNLLQAKRKRFFGIKEGDPFEIFKLNKEKGTVHIRGAYIISAPPNFLFRDAKALTMEHDDIYIDMYVAVKNDGKAKIIKESWEYSINTPDFPSNPGETLRRLKEYLDKEEKSNYEQL